MFERFGEKLRHAMAAAQRESRILGHGFIGTDHVLLGLADTEDSIAAHALLDVGVDAAAVRALVAAWHQGGHEAAGPLPLTPETKRILTFSFTEARREGHPWTGTGHVLLGLLADRDNAAVRLLLELGVDCGRLRTNVLRVAESATEERPPVVISLARYGEIVEQTAPLSEQEERDQARIKRAAQEALELLAELDETDHQRLPSLRQKVRAGAHARIALMNAGLSSVVYIANALAAEDEIRRDLVRRGNLGLEQAVDTYDWESHERFSDYARRVIRESMPANVKAARASKAVMLCILCSVPVEGAPKAIEPDTVLVCPSCAHRFALAWSTGGV